jgi:hypothetical protein
MEIQLVPSAEFEQYGDFNPDKITAFLGTKARLNHFEVLSDPQTHEDVKRYPVYSMGIVNPETLEPIEIFLKPDIRTVTIVAYSQPVDLIIAMGQGRGATSST